MTLFRCFAIAFAPFLLFGACSDENSMGGDGGAPDPSAGERSDGGEGGNADGGKGGASGTGHGGGGISGVGGEGAAAGLGGDAGDAGSAGEPAGGTPGSGGTSGTGGSAGRGGNAGMAGGGMGESGGMSGNAGGGSSCTTVDVPLGNADFDQNAAGWTPYDDGAGASRPIIVSAASLGITANSAPNVAHLGGADDVDAGMYQAIAIPAGAVNITLTGYRRITTEEIGAIVFDEMLIQLWEDAAAPSGRVGEVAAFSNSDASDEWVSFTSAPVDVAAHAGRTLELDLWSGTDEALLTDFYLDSLVLTALVCP